MSNSDLVLYPIPSVLIESLRDIGYSFNTALADIIDNSLAASASSVKIFTDTEEDPLLAVIDNGEGLSREQLIESLRIGSSNPREERKETDLGRFGLGLKTASFSQCRSLTVASRKNGTLSAFSWNLDHVVQVNQWELISIEDTASIPFIETLASSDGTLVLWENLDRVVGDAKSRDEAEKIFLRTVKEAEDHLSLVFHRFLEHEPGYKKISIELNGRALSPIDPFNTSNQATIVHPKEPVMKGVNVQAYTLPHSTKYQDKMEYEKYGLTGGYLKNQGIYLYRARRLIIYGTWFGLAKKQR